MIAQGCRIASQVCIAVGLALLLGCAGKGEMVSLNVQPQQPFVQSGQPEPLKIVIEPFEELPRRQIEDRSAYPFGRRGDEFQCQWRSPGVTIAEALAETLRWRGWNRRGWDARVVQSGVGILGADIVIGGEIRTLRRMQKAASSIPN